MTVGAYCDLSGELTAEEISAGSHYGADARFLHAWAQNQAESLVGQANFDTFMRRAPSLILELTSAIGKSRVRNPLRTYAGHGWGLTLVGSLRGTPVQFVGLEYQYAGFVSTSAVREKATGSFLEKTARRGSNPVLLQFDLPAGFNALDMGHVGHGGEFEVLIGRNQRFKIVAAASETISGVTDPVLVLDLVPA